VIDERTAEQRIAPSFELLCTRECVKAIERRRIQPLTRAVEFDAQFLDRKHGRGIAMAQHAIVADSVPDASSGGLQGTPFR
jgi:hypothetical protein